MIFSESKETAHYLAEKFADEGFGRVLLIDGDSKAAEIKKVSENFDENLEPAKDKKNDYDILITTEVLAEGVNLHHECNN